MKADARRLNKILLVNIPAITLDIQPYKWELNCI